MTWKKAFSLYIRELYRNLRYELIGSLLILIMKILYLLIYVILIFFVCYVIYLPLESIITNLIEFYYSLGEISLQLHQMIFKPRPEIPQLIDSEKVKDVPVTMSKEELETLKEKCWRNGYAIGVVVVGVTWTVAVCAVRIYFGI